MRTHRMAPIALMLAALALAAPGAALGGGLPATDPEITDGSEQRDLDAARAAWRAWGVRHYLIRVAISCNCSGVTLRPKTIEVRDGKPLKHPPARVRHYATVGRLYAYIQAMIDGGVANLQVDYGGRGVPRQLYVNPSRDAHDEETGVNVRSLRPLD